MFFHTRNKGPSLQQFAMSTNEFNALVKSTEKFVDHFAACDLISVGAKLVGGDLMPVEVYTELDSLDSPQAKAKKITQALILLVKAKQRI